MITHASPSQILSLTLFALSGFICCFLFKGGTDISYMPALLLTSMGVFLAWSPTRRIEIPLHSFIYGLFLLYAGLSFFWSGAPYITLTTWLIICMMPISYLLGRCLLDFSPRAIHHSFVAFITIGALSCLYGLWIFNVRLHSVFSNPNTYAAFLVLSLIPCAVFFIQKRKPHRYIWGFLSALFIIALLLTGSRSGLLTALFSLTLIFTGLSQKNIWKYVLLFGGGYALMMTIAFWLDLPVFKRILYTFSEQYQESLQGRLIIWAGSWALAKDHLFYGTGLGTFFLEYPPYRQPYDPSVGDWAHWDGLQLWGEIGVFGAALWYGFWGSLATSMIHHRKTCSSIALIGGVGCFALFFQSHFTYLYTLLPLLFVMGMFLAFYDHETQGRPVLSLSKRPCLLILGGILLLALQSSGSMYFIQQAQKDPQKISFLEKLNSPSFYEYDLIRGRKGDLTALQHAKEKCHACSMPYLIEGFLYLQNHNKEKAEYSFKEALKKDPSNQMIRIHLIRLLLSKNHIFESQIWARKAFAYPLTPDQKKYFLHILKNKVR